MRCRTSLSRLGSVAKIVRSCAWSAVSSVWVRGERAGRLVSPVAAEGTVMAAQIASAPTAEHIRTEASSA